jgi:hypothetical protein
LTINDSEPTTYNTKAPEQLKFNFNTQQHNSELQNHQKGNVYEYIEKNKTTDDEELCEQLLETERTFGRKRDSL